MDNDSTYPHAHMVRHLLPHEHKLAIFFNIKSIKIDNLCFTEYFTICYYFLI